MIEIVKYIPFQKGSIIGFVNIIYDGWIIRKIVHLQKNDKKWFSFPSYSEENKGEKYFPHYLERFSQEENAAFFKELAEKVRLFLEQTQEVNEPELPF